MFDQKPISAIENNRHFIIPIGNARIIAYLDYRQTAKYMLPAERSRRHNARRSFVDANQTLFELSIATKIRRLRNRVVYITEQEEGQQEARDR